MMRQFGVVGVYWRVLPRVNYVLHRSMFSFPPSLSHTTGPHVRMEVHQATIDVIDARPDDFLRMVTLNHATLWVGTIPHVALQNGHVSNLVSLSRPRCDLR